MIRHFATQYNTTGPVNTTFQPNPARVGIILSPNVVVLGVTVGTLITFDTGAVLERPGGGTLPLIMLLKDLGDIVQRGFVITAITTAHTGIITELILPPDLLSAELDKWRM